MAEKACRCKKVECEECPEWIFTFADLIAYTTTFMTLKAGDVICTGTPTKKTKSDPPVWLKPGDTIEVECPDIGVLRMSVVDEA